MAHKHPLVAFREANHLTQAEAAALVDMKQAQWSRLESGAGTVRPEMAKRISKVTGVALEVILNVADDNEPVAPAGTQPKA